MVIWYIDFDKIFVALINDLAKNYLEFSSSLLKFLDTKSS